MLSPAPILRRLRTTASTLSSLPTRRASTHWAMKVPEVLKGFLPAAVDTKLAKGKDTAEVEAAEGSSVYDGAVVDVMERERGERKVATFHKSSTANFKTSRRKLNDLSRLMAGRGVDEGILQLKVSPKKQSSRLLSMLALARDHAIAKGLNRDKLVIAQSWTTQGPSLVRLDIKGRGRRGIKHHPSSKLHVLLAEGDTAEEKKRARKLHGWRMSCRGLSEDGVGVGPSRPVINVGLGGWKW